MEFIGLTTPRLRLRPFVENDLEAFTAYRNDPSVARYQSWETYDLERAQSMYQDSCMVFNKPDSWYQMCIADVVTDRILGDCCVHFMEEGNQCEIGFTLASDNQKQGYAFEAVGALVEFLFNSLKMHRLTATVDVLNESSTKLLEKLGFRREGHYVENIWFKGSWGSEYSYALLASEHKTNGKTKR